MEILSKRENIYYIERAKVFVQDQVIHIAQRNGLATSIPDKTTMLLLLGSGTSITQAAIHMLAESNVVICFTSGKGSPLIMSSDSYMGEMKYAQKWFSIYNDKAKRLEAAKIMCRIRVDLAINSKYIINDFGAIDKSWSEDFMNNIELAKNTNELMGFEGIWARRLYSHMAKDADWKRTPKNGEDIENKRLDHGNYIAYGFAAVALKALNIPYSLPVFHGRTNRGALIFDVADIVKDSVVMPTAFAYVDKYRDEICARFKSGRKNYIEHMIDTMKVIIDTLD